jgi:hypothetical protein
MAHSHSEVAVNARLLKVGLDPGDLYPQMPMWFRYQSLDELFFALVNLNVGPEGQA